MMLSTNCSFSTYQTSRLDFRDYYDDTVYPDRQINRSSSSSSSSDDKYENIKAVTTSQRPSSLAPTPGVRSPEAYSSGSSGFWDSGSVCSHSLLPTREPSSRVEIQPTTTTSTTEYPYLNPTHLPPLPDPLEVHTTQETQINQGNLTSQSTEEKNNICDPCVNLTSNPHPAVERK